MDMDNFYTELEKLGNENGSATIEHLILIVGERETLTPDSTLAAARVMDWERLWDDVVGPVLDKIEEVLVECGAVRIVR